LLLNNSNINGGFLIIDGGKMIKFNVFFFESNT
jgi:hypothetical protein